MRQLTLQSVRGAIARHTFCVSKSADAADSLNPWIVAMLVSVDCVRSLKDDAKRVLGDLSTGGRYGKNGRCNRSRLMSDEDNREA
jgi:hypothetical protein